eukprot:TRINITY_DN1225_c0_g1_i1.p1 TRINITY_DN1225_c0_g1~~TRINITY_DN1225_c0_g1_i1.p1  ORF type:complete len:276 (+),score=62.16 TRINITY_DN1225_c0_g1_i1:99-926(+)
MNGFLIKYCEEFNLNGFVHGDDIQKKCMLLILNGFGDKINSLPYIEKMTSFLKENFINCCVVDLDTRGSGNGCAFNGLTEISEDVEKFITYASTNFGIKKFILWGYSSGCNVICRIAQRKRIPLDICINCVLQAPVSDYDFAKHYSNYNNKLDYAIANPEKLLPLEQPLTYMRMTGSRFFNLYAQNGDDEYFSAHFDEETLIERFEPLKCFKNVVLYSLNDEYVFYDDYYSYIERFSKVFPNVHVYTINANHDLSICADEEFSNILKQICRFFSL